MQMGFYQDCNLGFIFILFDFFLPPMLVTDFSPQILTCREPGVRSPEPGNKNIRLHLLSTPDS